MTLYQNTLEFAQAADLKDPLRSFRDAFYLPQTPQGGPTVYLCGNSLGLQPKQTEQFLKEELDSWRALGVDGHTEGTHPWLPYHEFLTQQMAEIVGAKDHEVVVMNGLTANLHLMMVSFYRPTDKRFKVVIEKDAFPSDRYAVESQLRFHGYDPKEALIQWAPPNGEELCNFADLEDLMTAQGHQVALVLLGNTNYYTGQAYPIDRITNLGHQHGALVGFDLAHGVGNIMPELHKNGPDFAVWCTYKYLNSGPGSLGGVFVHERHAQDKTLPRFTGWWGHNKTTRFNMRHDFDPIPGAEGWQLSNPPILSMAAIRASLDLFHRASMTRLRAKSIKLTGYLEYLIDDLSSDKIRVITPRNPLERGCQLSLQIKDSNKLLHDALTERGVVCDWREPDVIRVAPTPMYNSFEDVFQFVKHLKEVVA